MSDDAHVDVDAVKAVEHSREEVSLLIHVLVHERELLVEVVANISRMTIGNLVSGLLGATIGQVGEYRGDHRPDHTAYGGDESGFNFVANVEYWKENRNHCGPLLS
ncbi:MAG: hypothetical protein FWD75_03915 [Propionibacteriaceae bacterium]|nr:hypothetical protein [Propionibacteriaceae bacterium]